MASATTFAEGTKEHVTGTRVTGFVVDAFDQNPEILVIFGLCLVQDGAPSR